MSEKVKNGITELVFIIDKSGSMAGLESDTIGGFNAMIAKQKKLEGKVLVSTILFSDRSAVVHDRTELSKLEPMTENDYVVGGGTALLDAIGGAIQHIGNIHKYARPEDVPEKTMFVITTDGMENASREYSSGAVKKMIHRQKECCGWEFLFIAANIDSVETAEKLGIRRDRAANFVHDPKGTGRLYRMVDATVGNYRKNSTIKSDWNSENEDEDE